MGSRAKFKTQRDSKLLLAIFLFRRLRHLHLFMAASVFTHGAARSFSPQFLSRRFSRFANGRIGRIVFSA